MARKHFFGELEFSFNKLSPIDYILLAMIFIVMVLILMPSLGNTDSSGNTL